VATLHLEMALQGTCSPDSALLIPYWLVNFANTCIVIHLIGAYQVTTGTTPYIVLIYSGRTIKKHFKSLWKIVRLNVLSNDFFF